MLQRFLYRQINPIVPNSVVSIMNRLTRIIFLACLVSLFLTTYTAAPTSVEQWSTFELTLPGPSTGNPFLDIQLSARFTQGNSQIQSHRFLRWQRHLPHPLHA